MPIPSEAREWKPRASVLGSYFSCDYRAAMDRAVFYGDIERIEQGSDSKYADFGTLCHWRTQELLDATFPERAEPPTIEQVNSASKLHGGDASVCREMVERVAERAAIRLSTVGSDWLAETEWDLPFLSGHIDFLSRDHNVIVDLKTTSRKPMYSRPKPAHVYQMVSYYILSGKRAQSGHLLYVDSAKAGWTVMCDIDYTATAMQDLVSHTEQYIQYLRSNELPKRCVPHLGAHCREEFCPYIEQCRDVYVPAPGVLDEDSTTIPNLPRFSL